MLSGQEGKPFKKIWDEIARIWDAINSGARFPQPDFDSNWIDITSVGDLYYVITHNLAGLGYSNVDNYVIDLQYKNLSGDITHYDYGGSVQQYSGAWWSELNDYSIKVE